MTCVALLAEGVDRNRAYAMIWQEWFRSPSSRRAWIEIDLVCSPDVADTVALLAEGVDRNKTAAPSRARRFVALLAEGVDRNFLV